MITYEIPTDIGDKEFVEVTFTDQSDKVYIKNVNVPRLNDGSIDEDYFQEILEGQLSGIKNKLRVGSIKFYNRPEPSNLDNIPETVRETSR